MMPSETLVRLEPDALQSAIDAAQAALCDQQAADGHWLFELEADATIPAGYVLLEHYLDRIDPALQAKMGAYLRSIQGADGGWPLFHDGASDLSASVQAYFALKAVGDLAEAPHMARARGQILAMGGAERTNVFTRIQLALFGQVPWRAVPVMPVEIMNLPRWFFFHISKVSYWSRTVMVPLVVLMTLRPQARNPRGVGIAELFRTPPDQVKDWIRGPYRSSWGIAFKWLDSLLRPLVRFFPASARRRAIDAAVAFTVERLNGEDGLGAIYPAMANSLMMFDVLGYPADHPHAATAWAAIRRLLRIEPDRAYCQPCLSPIWDTGLAGLAMAEADGDRSPVVAAACDWLAGRQVTAVRGDWAWSRPDLLPGGWAFQYENAHYPDVDDTAVVAMLLHRTREHPEAVARARDWIIGMQSSNGGWGAFDVDNDYQFLNHIPFADHGALLDPPTVDVTARCVSFLAELGHARQEPVIRRALAYLLGQQEEDGSWFGRWGTNYIYGTWSALCALNAVGLPLTDLAIRKGACWLLACQRSDGGWGEDEESYGDAPHGHYHRSTPSQTAWALLGLMAAGEVNNPAVASGIEYLRRTQTAAGEWDEAPYTAVGFPRVFYLRYHGYRLFFPLLALARYRNLRQTATHRVALGL